MNFKSKTTPANTGIITYSSSN